MSAATDTFAVVMLWAGVVTFGFFGVLFTVRLNWMLAKMGIETGNTGRVDLIATYVGFELGFSIFLAWCALEPERLRLGLVASGLAFAGFGGARAVGLVIYRDGVARLLYLLLGLEVLGAGLSFYAASRLT